MELDSLREKTRRDVEGIHKKLQVIIHVAKLEKWEAVVDLIIIINNKCFI